MICGRVGDVAIHLRQGYGGQDVKVLPVSVFNACSSKHFSVEHYRAAKIFDSEQKAIEEYAEVVRASRIIKDEPSLIRTTFQSILHRGKYCGKALVRMLNAVLRQADKIKRRTNCCAS